VRAAVAALALLTALVGAAPAAAGPPRPSGVYVQGGEDAWHADPGFAIGWASPGDTSLDVAYSVSNAGGSVVRAGRFDWPAFGLHVELPRVPGIYTARIRYERGESRGPWAEAKLRFDDARPGAIEPDAPQGWIGRSDFPLRVRLGPPDGAAPISGIRGYAVAVAKTPATSPCASASGCTEAETDVRDGHVLTLAGLPEGSSHLAAVAVSGAGLTSPTVARRRLDVDTVEPSTRLLGVTGGWTRGPVRLGAVATDAVSGMAGARAFTAIRVDGDAPRIAAGPEVEATLIGEGAHRVAYYAGDAAGNADDGARVNGHLNPPPRTAVVRIDRTPPRAGFLPQDPADPELLRVRVRDALSGPAPSRGWIGVRPAGSSSRFQRLPAAPSAGSELRARWNSAAHPLGLYEFRATVHDAAGNRAATERREGGKPMRLVNPLKATTGLSAGFGGRVLRWHRCRKLGRERRCRRQTIADFSRRPARRAVPYGRGLPLSGRLVAGSGAAPGPRPVRIVERFALGARLDTRTTTVWTAPSGEFSTRLAPGPTREVSVGYAGGRTLQASSGPALRLQVRSGVRLGASSRVARIGGAPLVLRGKVRSDRGEVPPGGLSVQLQFRLPGLAWEEFRTVETDRRGRFRLAYRFSDDDSRGARFQFRAHVPAQSEWPYEPGSSRPLAVLGL
jgi:hypothetical protein